MASNLDLLTLTATQAANLLSQGTVTSSDLVQTYLAQISAHNHSGLHLNALISTAPTDLLLLYAQKLDSERATGHLRSPLHGIPIIIKDTYLTSTSETGLPTTAGSPCFLSATSDHNSPVVQKLLDAGLIILGKANMTEFCGLKYKNMTPGWCPAGGQTMSPYVFRGLEKDELLLGNSSAGGSSSGSAVSVAAGFAPLSLGTEAVGSVITPANRAGLFALKCGGGTVDTSGNFRFAEVMDFVGCMGKRADDVALLAAVVMGRERPFDLVADMAVKGVKVGFPDPAPWLLPEEICRFTGEMKEQMLASLQEAKERLKALGAIVSDDVKLTVPWASFKWGDDKSLFYETAMQQLKDVNLPAFFNQLSSCEVDSLESIIAWNERDSDICLPPDHPSQHELIDLLDNKTTAEQSGEMAAELRKRGCDALDPVFETVDIVIAFADSPLCMYTSASGYPIACVPLGTVKYSEQNERPFGLCLAAKAGREELLLRFMHAYERASPPRPLPKPLLAARKNGEVS